MPASPKRISTGNFDDDLPGIKTATWIIEVVIERLDIKQQVLANVGSTARRARSSPATPAASRSRHRAGRSDDFRKHFCGTHFFNPPRYLPLLEPIPGPDTDPAVLDFPGGLWPAYPRQGHRALPGHARLHRQPHRRVRHHGPLPPRGGDGPHRGGSGPPHRSRAGPPEERHLPHRRRGGPRHACESGAGREGQLPQRRAERSLRIPATCGKWWRRTCSAARPARASSSRTAHSPKGRHPSRST
ncbi:MAG: hypothetical protein IPN85_18720 [Flavobacteriales bacterium]|nr:hypothetical protein [Flavobacteriales bacterium]